jgi:hypothetical protein
MVGSKESILQIRITAALENNIDEVVQLFKDSTGVKVTKTQVIESALDEGLEILKKRLQNRQ